MTKHCRIWNQHALQLDDYDQRRLCKSFDVFMKSTTDVCMCETTTLKKSSSSEFLAKKSVINEEMKLKNSRHVLNIISEPLQEDRKYSRSSLSTTYQASCRRCGITLQDNISAATNKSSSRVSLPNCNSESYCVSSNKFNQKNYDEFRYSNRDVPRRSCCKCSNTSHGENKLLHLQSYCEKNAETLTETLDVKLCTSRNINNMHGYKQSRSKSDNSIGCTSTVKSEVNHKTTKDNFEFFESRRDILAFCKHKKFSKRFSVTDCLKSGKSQQKQNSNLRTKNQKTKNIQTRRRTSIDNSLYRYFFGWITILFLRFLNAGRIFSGTLTSRNRNGLASRCIVFAMWALIVLPGDTKRVLGNTLLVTPNQFCTRSRFMNSRQHEICHNHSDIIKYVEEGVLLGSHRCQREFQYNRWNCSRTPKIYYSRLLNNDLRETAYVSAVTSAAVTYSLTYACSKGEIPNCGCVESAISSYDLLKQEAIQRKLNVDEDKLRKVAATFEWGGCSDNVEYGERISRLFTENFGRRYQSNDLKAKMERHNLAAGRLAISNHMKQKCQCHGLTGACTFETCWDTMPKWQDVGVRLRNRFNNAVRVQLANDGRALLATRKQRLAIKEYPYPRKPYPRLSLHRRKKRSPSSDPSIYSPKVDTSSLSLITEARSATERRRKRRKKSKSLRHRRGGNDRQTSIDDENLVYSQESPNFCKRSRKLGSIGTTGRRCLPNTTGAGSCDYLCCGKTHTEHRITVTKDCNCRFEYCCQIVCDKCSAEETVHTCD